MYRMIIETGPQNILYVAALFAAGRLVHPVVFLAGTSFVHYPRYVTTYYHRGSDLDFGRFKSDALFFKTVALSHIGCRYVSAMLATSPPPAAAVAALSFFMVATGSAVSFLAARALGVDRTYFGAELGVCEMKQYRAPPHDHRPARDVLGVYLLPEFRAAWPWLMPTHWAFYIVVMMQEHFDVHARRVAGSGGPATKKNS